MVAVNPVNYGKAYKLSCAESIAASLFLGGFYQEADSILSRFKWGRSFFEVNKELFDSYKKCSTAEELKTVESAYIQKEIESRDERKKHNYLDDLNDLESNIEQDEEEFIDFNNINIHSLTDI